MRDERRRVWAAYGKKSPGLRKQQCALSGLIVQGRKLEGLRAQLFPERCSRSWIVLKVIFNWEVIHYTYHLHTSDLWWRFIFEAALIKDCQPSSRIWARRPSTWVMSLLVTIPKSTHLWNLILWAVNFGVIFHHTDLSGSQFIICLKHEWIQVIFF